MDGADRWFPVGDSLPLLRSFDDAHNAGRTQTVNTFSGISSISFDAPAPPAVEVGHILLGKSADALDISTAAFPFHTENIGLSTQTASSMSNRVIPAAAFSNDGSFIALGAMDGALLVYEWASMNLVMVVKAHTTCITSVAFSFDGTRLATVGADGFLRVWRTSTGESVGELAFELPPTNVMFSPHDRALIVVTLTLGLARLVHVQGNKQTLLPIAIANGESELQPHQTMQTWFAEETEKAIANISASNAPVVAAVQGTDADANTVTEGVETPALGDVTPGCDIQPPEAKRMRIDSELQTEHDEETSRAAATSSPLLPPTTETAPDEEVEQDADVGEPNADAIENENVDGETEEKADDSQAQSAPNPSRRRRGRGGGGYRVKAKAPRVPFDSATAACFTMDGLGVLVGTTRGKLLYYRLDPANTATVLTTQAYDLSSNPSVQHISVARLQSMPFQSKFPSVPLPEIAVVTTHARTIVIYAVTKDALILLQQINDPVDGMWRSPCLSRSGSHFIIADRGRQRPRIYCFRSYIKRTNPTDPLAAQLPVAVAFVQCRTPLISMKLTAAGTAPSVLRAVMHPTQPEIWISDKAGKIQVWRHMPNTTWTTYAPQLTVPEMMVNTPYKIVVDSANPDSIYPVLPLKTDTPASDPMHIPVDVRVDTSVPPLPKAAAIPLRFDNRIISALFTPYVRTLPYASAKEYNIPINVPDTTEVSKGAFQATTAFAPRAEAFVSVTAAAEMPDTFAAVPLVDAGGKRVHAASKEAVSNLVTWGLLNEGAQAVLRAPTRDIPIHWLPEPNEVPEPIEHMAAADVEEQVPSDVE